MRYLKTYESKNNKLDFEIFKELFLDIVDDYGGEFDLYKNKYFSLEINFNLFLEVYVGSVYEVGLQSEEAINVIKERLDEIYKSKIIQKNHESIISIIEFFDLNIKPRLKFFTNYSDCRFGILLDKLTITIEIKN